MELTQSLSCLLSSAARSSLRAILLLLPVFFLGRHPGQVLESPIQPVSTGKSQCKELFEIPRISVPVRDKPLLETHSKVICQPHLTNLEAGALRWSSPSLAFSLQQPGLLCERSFFFYQSSFFGRHPDQAPRVRQESEENGRSDRVVIGLKTTREVISKEQNKQPQSLD